MNIYQKLQLCRVKLQELELKKTGWNKFSEYSYFELDDFLPSINKILNENGLCTVVTFTETAQLTLIDCDKPEDKIIFESPICEIPTLKACHKIQGLGALQSYLRRYLYINLFEITEPDALDASTGKPETNGKKPEEPKKPTDIKPVDQETLQKLKVALYEMAGKDKEKSLDLLEKYTSFTNKEGKEIKGKRDFAKLSEAQVRATWGQVKKDLEAKKAS